MEQYLTSEQVAKKLQVHPFTVLKYLKSGTLKGVKIGRMYRIKESDVEQFLAGSETQSSDAQTPSADAQASSEASAEDHKNPIHKIEFTDDEPETKEQYYKI